MLPEIAGTPRYLLVSAQAFAFIDGWRALPEELQFHILLMAVAPAHSRRGTLQVSYHHIKAARYWNQHPFLGLTVPLLSCPEIKPLILEAFYTQNTFLLDYSLENSSQIYLPPQKTYKFIRRLQLRLGVMSQQRYELLEKAAVQTGKLENLTFLDIHFRTPFGCPRVMPDQRHVQKFKQYLDSIESVRFESRYVRVTYEHFPMSGDYRVDPWEAGLLDKLTLHPSLGGTKTNCTRFTLRSFQGLDELELREVDSWDRSREFHHAGRWTVKEVVIQGENHRLEPYTRYNKKFGLV